MNSGWVKATLGDFVKLQRGHDLPESQRRAGIVPVIGSAGITGYHDTARAKGPGVTVGRSGASFGVVNYSPVDYWPHNAALYVTDFHGNYERFAYYFLKSLNFKNYNSGSAQQSLNRNFIYPIKISIPPVEIQRRIAAILSAYDDLIENNTRRIQSLEEMARLIYEEWLVRFRFPGHENVKMVESELGLIPDGWDVKTLGEVCLRITDGSHSSPPSVQAGLPMASVKDMNNWGIKFETCRKISVKDYEQLVRNDCKPLLNDVLIAKDGSYLKHIFVVDKETDLVILSSIAILRPNDKIRPNVLAMYLKQPSITQRMKGYVSGVAIPRIVLKDFRQFKIVAPPIRLQNDWATVGEPLLAACRNLNGKNSVLSRTRDLLLPKLISGEIDVSNFPEPVDD